MASALYNKGIEYITAILEELEAWIDKSHYHSVEHLRGALERKDRGNRNRYERAQFMKYYSSHEK